MNFFAQSDQSVGELDGVLNPVAHTRLGGGAVPEPAIVQHHHIHPYAGSLQVHADNSTTIESK